MFEGSKNSIFETIGGTIKARKQKKKMKRADLLNDEALVSRIVKGTPTDKHPNVLSNDIAIDLAKKLEFASPAEMLWGNIDWNDVFEKALHEIFLYHGSTDTMNNLHNLLFEVLASNVNFANMRAANSYGFYLLDGEDRMIRDKAIQEFFLRAELQNSEPIQQTLKHRFHQQFDEKLLIKFTVRFPKFLASFFEDMLTKLKPADNATGRLAYQLSINAYEAFEMESNAWYYHDKRLRKKYTEISAELNIAITAMQKLHAHELSLELHQQKNFI